MAKLSKIQTTNAIISMLEGVKSKLTADDIAKNVAFKFGCSEKWVKAQLVGLGSTGYTETTTSARGVVKTVLTEEGKATLKQMVKDAKTAEKEAAKAAKKAA